MTLIGEYIKTLEEQVISCTEDKLLALHEHSKMYYTGKVDALRQIVWELKELESKQSTGVI